jgi:SAM-dependent methyltransferase
VTEPAYLRDTRHGYDAFAEEYAENVQTRLADRPLSRAMLAAFADLVRDAGPVADIGCGPGPTTAHLHDLGVDVTGIDLSPRMLAIARRTHPHLRFTEGTMTALDLPDGALAGICAWYSLIHIPPPHQPAVLAEFHRALAPGGHLLLAFQIGDTVRHYDDAFGHAVSLDFHRLSPDTLTGHLQAAGFDVRARMVREPNADEQHRQGVLIARRA